MAPEDIVVTDAEAACCTATAAAVVVAADISTLEAECGAGPTLPATSLLRMPMLPEVVSPAAGKTGTVTAPPTAAELLAGVAVAAAAGAGAGAGPRVNATDDESGAAEDDDVDVETAVVLDGAERVLKAARSAWSAVCDITKSRYALLLR